MKIKDGVSAIGVTPSVEHALLVTDLYFQRKLKRHAVITALQDGTHSESSFHYGRAGITPRAMAFDLRTNDLSGGEIEAVASALRLLLGSAFDVVVESTHIHVELDPKLNGERL